MASLRKAIALGLLNAADKGLGQMGKTYEDKADIKKQVAIRNATAKSALKGFEEYEGLDPSRKDEFLRYKHGGQVGFDEKTGRPTRLYKPTSGGGGSENLKKLAEQARVKQAKGQVLTPIEQNYIKQYDLSKMNPAQRQLQQALQNRKKTN